MDANTVPRVALFWILVFGKSGKVLTIFLPASCAFKNKNNSNHKPLTKRIKTLTNSNFDHEDVSKCLRVCGTPTSLQS